jgi:hypothetical protein
MRRKNRKWVALAVLLYGFLMWSAFRWSIAQRPADGSILEHIQREETRKFKEKRAKEGQEQAEALHLPTGESRLNAAGPAYVAVRYDESHVVFLVAGDTQSRFLSNSSLRFVREIPDKIPAASHPAAPLAGLQELWEPDSTALHFFPAIIQKTPPGEPWILSAGPGLTFPVVIDRPVIAPTGCSLGFGFLASIAPEQQSSFNTISNDYFVVRRASVESADPPVSSRIAELPSSKPSFAMQQQLVAQLSDRMQHELAQIDARLLANAHSPGETSSDLPIGNARPRLQEWLRADQGLARGEGVLDYDIRAFRLTPDSVPRLFVRARWKLDGIPVFLMTAWFKSGKREFQKDSQKKEDLQQEDLGKEEVQKEVQKTKEPAPQSDPQSDSGPILLFADATWSLAMRQGESSASLGDRLDFQTILNQFDADHDGWAELLIHSSDPHSSHPRSNPAASTTIALYLYTDVGLVPMQAPFHRDAESAESCLAQ